MHDYWMIVKRLLWLEQREKRGRQEDDKGRSL
jgi:hypothetical protein